MHTCKIVLNPRAVAKCQTGAGQKIIDCSIKEIIPLAKNTQVKSFAASTRYFTICLGYMGDMNDGFGMECDS